MASSWEIPLLCALFTFQDSVTRDRQTGQTRGTLQAKVKEC